MANTDYSTHFYTQVPTTELPLVGQNLSADDYQLLRDAAGLVQGAQDEGRLVRWLARFGIQAKVESPHADAAAPLLFSDMQAREFDRASFDYQAYLDALDKGE